MSENFLSVNERAFCDGSSHKYAPFWSISYSIHVFAISETKLYTIFPWGKRMWYIILFHKIQLDVLIWKPIETFVESFWVMIEFNYVKEKLNGGSLELFLKNGPVKKLSY